MAVITTDANRMLSRIHDRMPVLLPRASTTCATLGPQLIEPVEEPEAEPQQLGLEG